MRVLVRGWLVLSLRQPELSWTIRNTGWILAAGWTKLKIKAKLANIVRQIRGGSVAGVDGIPVSIKKNNFVVSPKQQVLLHIVNRSIVPRCFKDKKICNPTYLTLCQISYLTFIILCIKSSIRNVRNLTYLTYKIYLTFPL